jgi:hypothetical protein
MTPNDRITGYIRTVVPYAIGAFLTWLLSISGLDFTGELQVALIVFPVTVVTNVYYLLIRLLEVRFPWVGLFLGIPKTPDYTAVDNLWASLVRTAIPTVVAAVVVTFVGIWLNLDADTQSGVIVIAVALVQALYYAVARAILSRWPGAKILLGTPATPDYPARHALT